MSSNQSATDSNDRIVVTCEETLDLSTVTALHEQLLAALSDLSGRGVGMDVVRGNVQELGGDIAVESAPGRLGLVVDELQAQQQIVVKSLEASYGRVDGLVGATILSDGNVAFILDMAGLGRLARESGNRSRLARPGTPSARAGHASRAAEPS